jgi:hypothetical protein
MKPRKIIPSSETFTAVVKADRSGKPYIMVGSRKYSMNHGRFADINVGDAVSVKVKEGSISVFYSGKPGGGSETGFPSYRGDIYPFGKEKGYKERKLALAEKEHEKDFRFQLKELYQFA